MDFGFFVTEISILMVFVFFCHRNFNFHGFWIFVVTQISSRFPKSKILSRGPKSKILFGGPKSKIFPGGPKSKIWISLQKIKIRSKWQNLVSKNKISVKKLKFGCKNKISVKKSKFGSKFEIEENQNKFTKWRMAVLCVLWDLLHRTHPAAQWNWLRGQLQRNHWLLGWPHYIVKVLARKIIDYHQVFLFV